ncbi:MAG: periplasmic heavy metal sensor [Gemmatimonadota bacterium]|nr:periplasmic heavy metal sensor [Gemmatimonadota bacterium]
MYAPRRIRRFVPSVLPLALLALLAAPAGAQETEKQKGEQAAAEKEVVVEKQAAAEKEPAAPMMAGMAAMHGGRGMLGGISPAEKKALKEGKGLGAGRLAMMNGYPGPKHVLEMGDQFELTAAQRESLGTLFAEAKARFVGLGEELVREEETLEALFAEGEPDEEAVETRAVEIAVLQGKLRAAHLNTHLRTRAVLTPEQVAKLDAMHQKMMGEGHGEGMREKMRGDMPEGMQERMREHRQERMKDAPAPEPEAKPAPVPEPAPEPAPEAEPEG